MIFAWIGALMVGLSLGLLGSGGSILTVPILIYLVGEEEKVAIAESLGIVAAISFTGFITYAFNKQVHWKSVILFGLPGMAGAFFGASLANYISASAQLIIFGIVMLLAAVLMYRDGLIKESEGSENTVWWLFSLQGLGVGTLTGLIGVGGGFLIVPSLVLLGGLSINLAVGSSLAIIVMQSTVGFITYLDVLTELNLSINIELMIIFVLIGAVGSFVGKMIGGKISGEKLKKGFALFLIIVGSYIIFMNV